VGDLLVFVDDDNVLAANYLEEALRIATAWPILGAWGGSILPEFEAEPPEWVRPYLVYLSARLVERDVWSNLVDDHRVVHWGAGVCVRQQVATTYLQSVVGDMRRQCLDRRGNGLLSYGDVDLALTSCDLGLSTGLFSRLTLSHLIPCSRTDERYLRRLIEAVEESKALLAKLRGTKPKATPCLIKAINLLRALAHGRRSLRMHLAAENGRRNALRLVEQRGLAGKG
jgi:hypothetical protein